MTKGVITKNTTVATPMTISVTLATAEIASHASSSLLVARRSTKTGMKVADTIPPSTMSWMTFGIVFARL